MALTKFTTSMDIIAALDDEPNDVGGLTAAQLKAKFDEGCKAIQSFINTVLTAELDANFATKAEVQAVVLGQIPDGTITEAKLATDLTLGNIDIDGAIGSTSGLPIFTGTNGVLETKTVPNAMYALINGLSSVTPTTSDIIPLKDASESASGYATISSILALVPTGAQVASGSYTGTGTYGSSNPNSIALPVRPKIVAVSVKSQEWYHLGVFFIGENTNLSSGVIVNTLSISSGITRTTSALIATMTSGNVLSWYSTGSAQTQFNDAQTYSYWYLY